MELFPPFFSLSVSLSLSCVRTNKFRAKRATTKNDTTRHYVCSTKHEFYRRESCRGEIRQDDATVCLLLPEWFSARESCRFLFSVFYIFALYIGKMSLSGGMMVRISSRPESACARLFSRVVVVVAWWRGREKERSRRVGADRRYSRRSFSSSSSR